MSSHLKKMAISAGVVAALAGGGNVAGAAVLGGAAEALLVPLAVWSPGTFSIGNPGTPLDDVYTPAVDTVIEVWVPGAVGFDDIPNVYTARHTTPTNDEDPTTAFPEPTLSPSDEDLIPNGVVRWYWINKRGVELQSGTLNVTANDVVQVSITQIADGTYANVPGYFLITTDTGSRGLDANFSLNGNAWLTGALHIGQPLPENPEFTQFNIGIGFPFIGGSIPVLGMNDGADNANPGDIPPGGTYPAPTAQDSVKYDVPGLTPIASPLVSGFRTSRSDGDPTDRFVFDLALSNRFVPTIHVVWLDHNLGPDDSPGLNGGVGGDPGYALRDIYPENQVSTVVDNASLSVYDTDETACGGSINLPNRLNTIWIPPAYERNEDFQFLAFNRPFLWMTQSKTLCIPREETTEIDIPGLGVVANPDNTALFNAGFVQYRFPEYVDNDLRRAETAGFAFALKIDGGIYGAGPLDGPFLPIALVGLLESSLGHDRGTFKSAFPPADVE